MPGSIPCPSCGAPVAADRAACPSCGTLVASMAASIVDPVAAPDAPQLAETAPDAPQLADTAPDAPQLADTAPAPERADEPPVLEVADEALAPAVAVDALGPEVAGELAPLATAAATAAPAPGDTSSAADGIASGGIVPGSYLPPSTVHRAVPPNALAPDSVPAATRAEPGLRGGAQGVDALAWPGLLRPSATTTPVASGPPGSPVPTLSAAAAAPAGIGATMPVAPGAAAATTTSRSPAPRPGHASILADLPFDAPDELEGWLVVLGGGTALLGFLLPWRSALSSGFSGYFESWGLGIGTNLPIVVLVIVATALSIVPNRVADWFRHGVLGMVAGGVLFGLVWLYLSGGGELGAILAAVGAVLLIGGGVVAVSPGRREVRPEGR
ncbi:MAG: hypothetical protein HYX57_10030 [Chloroflexi bacterium]|nr:hypothetical protein [Chloroflexota bacterium]